MSQERELTSGVSLSQKLPEASRTRHAGRQKIALYERGFSSGRIGGLVLPLPLPGLPLLVFSLPAPFPALPLPLPVSPLPVPLPVFPLPGLVPSSMTE